MVVITILYFSLASTHSNCDDCSHTELLLTELRQLLVAAKLHMLLCCVPLGSETRN